MAIVSYGILNDIHFPYEADAYFVAIEMMRKWDNLKGIYLNGDVAEIESVSRHPKGPSAMSNLLSELEYVNQKFDTLTKIFPDVPVFYLEGNHENRIYRFIRDLAPQMWGMLNCPDIFKFSERPNWKFIPYGPTQLLKIGATKDLYCRHEPLVSGAFHAKGTAEKATVSLIYGHTHVKQQFTHKKFGPECYNVTAYSNGWLGDIKKTCFDYRGSKDNWQLGFSRVDCDEKTGDYEVRFIDLEGKKLCPAIQMTSSSR